MLDYRIKTFLTLCRQMNYRKTASELNLTQPAVTQHIHFLENYYQCRLVTYDRHTLRITPEGEILKQYAENMLYQENKLQQAMQPAPDIQLHIGATKTIGEYVLAGHVAAFASRPENSIQIEVENTEVLLKQLKSGSLDFALVEGNFDKLEFAWKTYKSEEFVGVCSAKHRFAGRTVSCEEIMQEMLIIREEGSGTRQILESLLDNENLSLDLFRQTLCVNNFGLLTGILERQGITFAYKAVARNHPALSVFQVQNWNVSHDFSYVYLENPESERAVEYFESFRPVDLT